MKKEQQKSPPDQSVQATAWFSVLMHARAESDFSEACKAKAALEDLGIHVRFSKAKDRKKGGQQ